MLGPETAHSPNADDLNALYWVLLVFGAALVVAINAALIALAMRFRANRGRQARRVRSGRAVQGAVIAVLTAVAAIVFLLGVIYTDKASDTEPSGPQGLQASAQRTAQRGIEVPPPETAPLEILASGQQWIWRYEYPDGTFSYYDLVVPVDTAVIINLDSTDVVHRWWVPGLSGKFDAVPNQSDRTWFKADQEGTYYGASYQFSGASYAAMRTQVDVVSVTEYEAWIEQQKADIQAAQAFVQQEVTKRGASGTEAGSPDVKPLGAEQ